MIRTVIYCDVLHQYHHLLRKSRLIKLEINNFYLCISISENSTDGLTIVCLCQINFSALSKGDELHFSIQVYHYLTLSPSYRPVPTSVAPPLTTRKWLPPFRLLPPHTGRWLPAKTMCQDNSTYCAHKTMTLHMMTLSTMFTNNFCACQSFLFTNIRLICSVLVEFRTSFFRVSTCFNGCVAAMDAQLEFGTRLRWFCDRGVW